MFNSIDNWTVFKTLCSAVKIINFHPLSPVSLFLILQTLGGNKSCSLRQGSSNVLIHISSVRPFRVLRLHCTEASSYECPGMIIRKARFWIRSISRYIIFKCSAISIPLFKKFIVRTSQSVQSVYRARNKVSNPNPLPSSPVPVRIIII